MLNAAQQNYHANKEALEAARQQEPGSGLDYGMRQTEDVEREKTARYAIRNFAEKKGKTKKTLNAFAVLSKANLLTDMPFVCAFLSAFLKEILDLIFAPTIVLPITFSILNCIFTYMMMQLAKFSERVKIHSRLMVKVVILIAFAIFDSLPGLNFFPLSITSLLIVYMITLWERANVEKTEKSGN